MAFTVQDGSGLIAGANAYVSISYMTSYFSDRGLDITDFDDDAIQASIVKATDYMDFRFGPDLLGLRLEDAQTTEMPRQSAIDNRGLDFSESIPEDWKKACCEYAYRELNSVTLAPDPVYDDTGQSIKSTKTKVDVIETSITYKDDYVKETIREYPKADMFVKPYLRRASVNVLFRG
jgi:hypothetical protein